MYAQLSMGVLLWGALVVAAVAIINQSHQDSSKGKGTAGLLFGRFKIPRRGNPVSGLNLSFCYSAFCWTNGLFIVFGLN